MEGYYVKLLVICLELIVVSSGDIEFTQVSLGITLITEGLRTDIICSVSNAIGYSISWYRETPRGDKTVIYRDGMLITSNLGREAEAYTKHTEGVRITNQRGRDLGYLLNGNIYTCEVSVNSTGEVVLVSTGLTVEAHYSPSSVYPICESCQFSSDFINTNITISCYSEPGEPRVELMWLKNGKIIQGLQKITTSSFIYLNYTFILEADDLQSSFTCNNGVRSCNCEQNTTPVQDLTTTPFKSSTSKKKMKSDSTTSTLTIIIGACAGTVVFLAICMLIIYIICMMITKKKLNEPVVNTMESQHELHQDSTNTYENTSNTIRDETTESGTVEMPINEGHVETENTKPETIPPLYAIVRK